MKKALHLSLSVYIPPSVCLSCMCLSVNVRPQPLSNNTPPSSPLSNKHREGRKKKYITLLRSDFVDRNFLFISLFFFFQKKKINKNPCFAFKALKRARPFSFLFFFFFLKVNNPCPCTCPVPLSCSFSPFSPPSPSPSLLPPALSPQLIHAFYTSLVQLRLITKSTRTRGWLS